MHQSIEDLQKAKVKLESGIAKLLYDFSQQRSFVISGLHVERIHSNGASPSYVVNVDAKVISGSLQDNIWLERQKRLLKVIADHAPFPIRKDLTISVLLSLALESLPERPQTTKQVWLKDALDSCLRGIQNTVMKEISWPDAIEVPRQLPVPISLADGQYPGPSDASDNGCVYAGVTLHRDPSRWHWRFAHYTLLEGGGFTHWLPPDVECLPARVEP